MNDSLAVSTRRYLAIALVIHVLVSLQYYAGWPFDGLCPTDEVRSIVCTYHAAVSCLRYLLQCLGEEEETDNDRATDSSGRGEKERKRRRERERDQ